MAATDVEFEQGAGSPEQLPQGATQELNAALPTSTASEPVSEAEAAAGAAGAAAPVEEVPIEPALPQDYDPVWAPETEEDDFIAGPTLSPEEPQSVGAGRRQPLSAQVRRSLPLLQQMAAEPGASPQLRALVSLMLREAQR